MTDFNKLVKRAVDIAIKDIERQLSNEIDAEIKKQFPELANNTIDISGIKHAVRCQIIRPPVLLANGSLSCPSCKKLISKKIKFCQYCGQKILVKDNSHE